MARKMKSPAHLIVVLWAAAWALFLTCQALAWGPVLGSTALWLALGAALIALALVPLRWEPQGGALLLVCGLAMLLAYQLWPPTQLRPGVQALLALLLTLPPLFTGLLFVSHRGHPIKIRIPSARG